MKFTIAEFKKTGKYGDYFEYKVIRELHPIELKYSVSSLNSTPKPYIEHQNEYMIFYRYSRNKNFARYHNNFKSYQDCKNLYNDILKSAKLKQDVTIDIIKEFPEY